MLSESQNPTRRMCKDEGKAISEERQIQACLYAAGALTLEERIKYEALMEQEPALLAYTTEMLELAAAVVLDSLHPTQNAPCGLKTQVLRSLDAKLEIEQFVGAYLHDPAEAAVFTDAAGLTRWVNPAFTAMCGFTLDELRGRKPGSILQGELTDQASVARIRQAIRTGTPCCEELINYHKDGHPYWVAIAINPIRGTDGTPRAFVAIESELKQKPIPTRA
jgi:PAS domain S-box-containing protein